LNIIEEYKKKFIISRFSLFNEKRKSTTIVDNNDFLFSFLNLYTKEKKIYRFFFWFIVQSYLLLMMMVMVLNCYYLNYYFHQ